MSDAHTDDRAKQQSRAIAQSLTRAGIGRAYHPRTLATAPQGSTLATWVRDEGRVDVARGKGVTFVGRGAESMDLAILTARGLHLLGIAALVTSLRKLVLMLDSRRVASEEHEALRTVPALVVTDFIQTYGGKPECPLTGWQVQDVEALLLDRLADNLAVFVHCDRVPGSEGWWSANLVQRLQMANRQIGVAS